MSNTLIQTSIQPEAIGEWLVHNAQASSTGLSWSFSYPSDPHQYLPEQAESLDREGGIIYFLLELYSCTKKAHYLKTALGVLEALLEHCAQTSTGNYSPFTGRSSLLVLLIKAHEVTTDQSYLKQALQLIQTFDHEAYLKSEYSANGFYHGRAGVLLNYLRLYQLTSDAELLQLIVDYTLAVCKGADNKPAGRLVWPEKDHYDMQPLCDLAWGNMGIAYVLLLVADYFDDPMLKELGTEALNYIADCWEEGMENWPDFRKRISHHQSFQDHWEKYTKEGPEFFTKTQDNHFWKHGFAGMTMAFLSLPLSAQSNKWTAEQLYLLMKKKQGAHLEGASDLINGWAGWGMLCLQAYHHFQYPAFKALAKEVADHFKKMDIDEFNPSLLSGHLGISYFLLQYEQAEQLDRLLCPGLSAKELPPSSEKNTWPLSASEVNKAVLDRHFYRSLYLMNQVVPQKGDAFFKQSFRGQDRVASLEKMIAQWVEDLKTNQGGACLADIFYLEKNRWQFYLEIAPSALVQLEEWMRYDQAIDLLNQPDAALLAKHFQLSDKVKILNTRWPWSEHTDSRKKMRPLVLQNLYDAPGDYQSLLFPAMAFDGVREMSIDVVGMVLQRFDQAKTIEEVNFELMYNLEEKDIPKAMLFTQSDTVNELISRLGYLVQFLVKQFLCDGCLVIVEKTPSVS